MEIQLTHPQNKSFKTAETARKKITDILISEQERFTILEGDNGRFYAVVITAFESNISYYAHKGFKVVGTMGDR